MKTILIVLAVALAGCAGQKMSPQEVAVRERCDYEAAKVSGYDWIDAASRRSDVRFYCLKQHGLSVW